MTGMETKKARGKRIARCWFVSFAELSCELCPDHPHLIAVKNLCRLRAMCLVPENGFLWLEFSTKKYNGSSKNFRKSSCGWQTFRFSAANCMVCSQNLQSLTQRESRVDLSVGLALISNGSRSDRREYMAITYDQLQAWSWSLHHSAKSLSRLRSQSSAV